MWQKLKLQALNEKRPILCLAPMYDVTDFIFRELMVDLGKPDVFYTEFVNATGLVSPKNKNYKSTLTFSEKQKPVIAQIWGNEPKDYYKAAKLLVGMGFDGVDINMGCPEKGVLKTGSCAALIKNRKLASEIILATKEGLNGKLPLSVKTRLGFKNYETSDWLSFLLGFELDALCIHGRTVAEMSKVPANWDEIAKAVEIRNNICPKTIILGNGDVTSYDMAISHCKNYKVDGIMIGRGVFTNPFIFTPDKDIKNLSVSKRCEILIKHTQMFVDFYKQTKNFNILKKFFKIYISGFDGASDVREKLMQTETIDEVILIINKYLA